MVSAFRHLLCHDAHNRHNRKATFSAEKAKFICSEAAISIIFITFADKIIKGKKL